MGESFLQSYGGGSSNLVSYTCKLQDVYDLGTYKWDYKSFSGSPSLILVSVVNLVKGYDVGTLTWYNDFITGGIHLGAVNMGSTKVVAYEPYSSVYITVTNNQVGLGILNNDRTQSSVLITGATAVFLVFF